MGRSWCDEFRLGGLGGNWRTEVHLDASKTAAARRIDLQTLARDGEEWLGEEGWNFRLAALRSVPGGRLLGEGFDKEYAERPDVGGRAHVPGTVFRWIVDAGRSSAPAEVRREHQAVIDDHEVGWPQMAVREIALVKIGECIKKGIEHLPCFL